MTELLCRLAVPAQPDTTPTHLAWDSDGIITTLEPLDPALHTPAELPLVTPAFADIHNHGGAGESFPTSDYDGCRAAARHHRAYGSTSLLASTVSQPREVLLPQLEILSQLCDEGELDGIHAEGPFVNTCRCGAQDPAAIIPGDPHLFREMIDTANGHLRSITFAPETPYAHELVDLCVDHKIIVSLGHTDADYETTDEVINYALSRGATVTATHLFNAMPPLHHRKPGPIAALIDSAVQGRVHVELIADGVHLHDGTVSLVLDSVDYRYATFVSDAMGAAGCADGNYLLGALAVTVKDSVARLTTTDGSEGSIAGGTSRVSDQVRRHVQRGLPIHKVLQAATSGHALIGRTGKDTVSVGTPLECVVWSQSMQVDKVYRNGIELEK